MGKQYAGRNLGLLLGVVWVLLDNGIQHVS